ncbi:MAG: hypothetical protein AMJ94_18425 [Deltaproteobacteria bacterium SM23_61]|jgi:hypothetical protein|nr:MAG: hypothetical protein AMJ94_18425 [Deltaproteobacteria bacterium SM23_61]
MKLLEDIVLTDSVEIGVTPDKVFDFFLQMIDDASYRRWHPNDHLVFRWIKGNPFEVGSVAYAEEYLHGKLHKAKFCVSKVVPNREIVYTPVSRILKIFFPRNRFNVEPKGDGCIFRAEVHLRIGRIAKALAKRKVEIALSSVRQHMKEEGENLKRILEKRDLHSKRIEATE